jgi:DNA ligase (NAD+)
MLKSPEEFVDVFEQGRMTARDAKDLKELLEHACLTYYETEHKIMSDEEYDRLNDIHEALTGEIVSGSKGTTGVSHTYDSLMCTLKKVNTIEELNVWLQETGSNSPTITLAVSNKMDGNSVMLEYESNGHIIGGVTRGKDGLGVDLAETFKGRDIACSLENRFGIKYEALVSKNDMDALSEKRGKELADPRSAVTGLLHKHDGADFVNFIHLAPIDIALEGGLMTRTEVIEFINALVTEPGFVNPAFQIVTGTPEDVLTAIKSLYEKQAKERIDWEYMVDGMVIEYVDEPTRERLGWHKGSSTYPKFAIALKYPFLERETFAEAMEFDVGPSGRVTPCVVFNPVTINGRTYRRTSIANWRRFQELKIGKGTRLLFSLRNDVLGYVDVLDLPENTTILPFMFTDICPVCGSSIEVNANETYAYCLNETGCQAHKVGKILHWVKKLSLKGIADSTLWKLIDNGIITEPRDLYHIDRQKAALIPGLGESSMANLMATVAGKLNPKDYEVLAAVTPEGIGRTVLKPVLRRYRLSELHQIAHSEQKTDLIGMLNECDGVSDVNAEKIIQGLQNPVIHWALYGGDLNISETYLDPTEKKTPTGSGSLKVCITGKIELFKNRDEFVAALEAKGHSFASSVSKDSDILVTNDPFSGSSKNRKAAELGKPIMTEREFVERYLE